MKNGFLNINKPSGISSSQVVGRIRYALGKKVKVGHMGTLDPMASGVLPIAVGRATRLFDFLLKKTKTYIATFEFGYTTDTLDATGQKVEENGILPDIKNIKSALPQFLGVIEQLPPQYSAKSVNGQRAYQMARNGEIVELKPCKLEIFTFKLIEQLSKSVFKFEIECSSGTYIRSLCRDLAKDLGCLATMVELVRTKSGVFTIEDAINFETVTEKQILPMEFVLGNLTDVHINKESLSIILQGKKYQIDLPNGEYKMYCDNELQAIVIVENGILLPRTWLR